MNALAFDTLAYVRRMEQAGFTRAQAEAMADEQAKLIDERLATKADIARIEATLDAYKVELSSKLDTHKSSLQADLRALEASLRAEIFKTMFGVAGLQTIVIIATMFGLIRTMIR